MICNRATTNTERKFFAVVFLYPTRFHQCERREKGARESRYRAEFCCSQHWPPGLNSFLHIELAMLWKHNLPCRVEPYTLYEPVFCRQCTSCVAQFSASGKKGNRLVLSSLTRSNPRFDQISVTRQPANSGGGSGRGFWPRGSKM